MISDTLLSLRRAFSLRRCEERDSSLTLRNRLRNPSFCLCEEHSDEAISVDLAGNEIATPRQVGVRNDTEGYYPMLQTYYKVSLIYLN